MTNALTIIAASPINTTAPLAWSSALAAPVATNTPATPRTVPPFIRADEAYYWSFQWQEDVRKAMEARVAGESVVFDSDDPNDVVRWLLDDEDEATA